MPPTRLWFLFIDRSVRKHIKKNYVVNTLLIVVPFKVDVIQHSVFSTCFVIGRGEVFLTAVVVDY
jgi:hypothetical protein